MAEPSDASRDLTWYRSRWETLMSLLSTSDPEGVLAEVRALRERANTLEAQRAALTDAGIESPKQALHMIENLEAQLTELYAEKEAEERSETNSPTRSATEDTFEQLRNFHAFQGTLQRELGLSSAHDIVEMVENLSDQLEILYRRRDASGDASGSSNGSSSSLERTLEEELGLSDPEAIVQLIRSMEAQLRDVYEDREYRTRPGTSSAIEPLVSETDRERLASMTDEQLDTLPAGAFCLDDEGVIQRANETALEWPGVTAETPESLEGLHFFAELASGAAAPPLLRDRYEEGIDTGAQDERFLCRYVGEEISPTPLVLHLYRPSDRSENWIFFRVR